MSARAAKKPLAAWERWILDWDLDEGPLSVVEASRPATRGECANGSRPCPFVSCRHHLYLDVQASGSIVLNFPLLEPHQLKRSCSLDEAERGPLSLSEVGTRMNSTRERVRQIEAEALTAVRERSGELPSPNEFLYPNEPVDPED